MAVQVFFVVVVVILAVTTGTMALVARFRGGLCCPRARFRAGKWRTIVV